MVSYYVYGRKGGFMDYNPDYSREETERFRKMALNAENYKNLRQGTAAASGTDGEEASRSKSAGVPDARFFYRIPAKEKGWCTVFGQSAFIREGTTLINKDRDTDFSFQFLLSGAEQTALMEEPVRLLEYLPFPENMDQICRPGNGESVLTENGAVLDEDSIHAFLNAPQRQEQTENFKRKAELYTTEELLEAFSLTGKRLTEFLYTLLLFNTDEKIYLMLPDNTKESTDKALALMCKVLTILPPSLVRYTGFLTYVSEVETSFSDSVPFEIRYLFLANTEKNQTVCRTTRYAYVFCPDASTGVTIPANMQTIAEHLTASFLKGMPDPELWDLWEVLDAYLKDGIQVPITPLEYHALYEFCISSRLLTDAVSHEQFPPETAIWKNIDNLRRMEKERSQIWQLKMGADVTTFVKGLIDFDVIEGEDGYQRLFAEYTGHPELRENIVNYFCRKVRNYAELEAYVQILEPCPELKKAVSDQYLSMFADLLRRGELEETLYPAVLEMYAITPVLQRDIQDFFGAKIIDVDTYDRYSRLIISSADKVKENTALWTQIEANLYRDPTRFSVVVAIESRTLSRIFANQNGSPADIMKSFWKCVERLLRLNADVVYDPGYFRCVKSCVEPLLIKWCEPETEAQILEDAQAQLRAFAMPEDYLQIFEDISAAYLNQYQKKIGEECTNPEMFRTWPLVSPSHPALVWIRNRLLKKQKEQENVALFEQEISRGTAASLTRFFEKQVNQEVIALARETGKGKEYVSSIVGKLEAEVRASGKDNPAKDCYDQLCTNLVISFPECEKQVYDYMMRSVYGGVPAMSSVYKRLRKTDGFDGLDASYSDSQSETKQLMAEAIRQYYRKYKMSGWDKRSFKDEARFLERIGLDAKTLR